MTKAVSNDRARISQTLKKETSSLQVPSLMLHSSDKLNKDLIEI